MMRNTRAQGREARGGIREGGGGAKKCDKSIKNYKGEVESGGELGGRRKSVDERGYLVFVFSSYTCNRRYHLWDYVEPREAFC